MLPRRNTEYDLTVASWELAACYLHMECNGVRYELLQTVHPLGWKWVAHIRPTKQITGFSSSKQLAEHAAKRAIDKTLEADEKRKP
jgi:hypothetical protein